MSTETIVTHLFDICHHYHITSSVAATDMRQLEHRPLASNRCRSFRTMNM